MCLREHTAGFVRRGNVHTCEMKAGRVTRLLITLPNQLADTGWYNKPAAHTLGYAMQALPSTATLRQWASW